MLTTFVLSLLLVADNAVAPGPVVQDPPPLEGVWAVVLQQRDCTTDAPIGPALRKLLTYEDGGTFIESSAIPAFLPGQLSLGHGIWSRNGRRYADLVTTMVVFDTAPGTPPGSPGFKAGWLLAGHSIRMTGRNSFSATGTNQLLDLNRQVYRSTCATRVGERLR